MIDYKMLHIQQGLAGNKYVWMPKFWMLSIAKHQTMFKNIS